jgi:hypothetical protein
MSIIVVPRSSLYPPAYRLNRSRLSRSWLRTRRMTPSLKNFSSPAAVRPPIYHLSAPNTSRKPSLLLSLPRRRPPCVPGMGIPRGECSGSWLAIVLPACLAGGVPVALGPPVPVDMARGPDAADAAAAAVEVVACLFACWVERAAGGCWRKAAKKVERKKGRCEGMVSWLRPGMAQSGVVLRRRGILLRNLRSTIMGAEGVPTGWARFSGGLVMVDAPVPFLCSLRASGAEQRCRRPLQLSILE